MDRGEERELQRRVRVQARPEKREQAVGFGGGLEQPVLQVRLEARGRDEAACWQVPARGWVRRVETLEERDVRVGKKQQEVLLGGDGGHGEREEPRVEPVPQRDGARVAAPPAHFHIGEQRDSTPSSLAEWVCLICSSHKGQGTTERRPCESRHRLSLSCQAWNHSQVMEPDLTSGHAKGAPLRTRSKLIGIRVCESATCDATGERRRGREVAESGMNKNDAREGWVGHRFDIAMTARDQSSALDAVAR